LLGDVCCLSDHSFARYDIDQVALLQLHPNLVVLRLSHPVKEFWNTVATQFFYG